MIKVCGHCKRNEVIKEYFCKECLILLNKGKLLFLKKQRYSIILKGE